jgi:predicted XRE-type DNA-binding protein
MRITIQEAYKPHLERVAKENNMTIRDAVTLAISNLIKSLTLKKKGKK